MKTKTLLLWLFSFCVCAGLRAQQPAGAELQSFTVLRNGRLIAPSETATNDDTHCAIIGTGGSATMQCRPAAVTVKTSYHYHTALIVDAQGVGYVIACREALVTNLWCKKADTGTVLQGRVSNGHISITDGEKLHDYQLLTSATVGAIPVTAVPAPVAAKAAKGQPKVAPAPVATQPATTATGAVGAGGSAGPGGAAKAPVEAAAACTTAGAACVSFVSEPSGADIYVDGKFVGNTPSSVALAPGSHEVRIESAKLKAWTRTLETTAGSKVTVRATLESAGSQP